MNKTNLTLSENSFVQHIADNADHDTCTLDGHGTFHGMAIIAAITPCTERSTVVIPREEVIITKSKSEQVLNYFEFMNLFILGRR